jgi:hypothetical protein
MKISEFLEQIKEENSGDEFYEIVPEDFEDEEIKQLQEEIEIPLQVAQRERPLAPPPMRPPMAMPHIPRPQTNTTATQATISTSASEAQ